LGDTAEEIERDIAAIGRIDAVPALLRVICETTGMGFAAVARVTDGSWTACAVQDDIEFGLKPGGQLDVHTTLCKEVRELRVPVVIDKASDDPVYFDHHTPRLYKIESYISVPIVLGGGDYFGNLCAIDPRPARVSEPRVVSLFNLFAQLIALQLDNDRKRELEEAAMLSERATGELREQFIAILGHDLRSPLAAVVAGGQLLEKLSDDTRVLSVAQRIRRSAQRMSGLIDDVLDFARGRLGGGFGVALADVDDLGQALRDVVAELQDSHPERRVLCEVSIDRAVHCDRGRVQQLVANLIGNALTHGAPHTPVRFHAITSGTDLVLTVTNQGDPIPAESLPHVFAPFWRRNTPGAREGLGLGLFICSQIVKAHDGSLDVSSSAQAGTTFVARLPLN
jgi:signal transduction histidine kinase